LIFFAQLRALGIKIAHHRCYIQNQQINCLIKRRSTTFIAENHSHLRTGRKPDAQVGKRPNCEKYLRLETPVLWAKLRCYH